MKVLLDHCVLRPFGRLLAGHEVLTARQMHWDDISNGSLMRLAAGEFGSLLTVDKKIAGTHPGTETPLPVIILFAFSNAIDDLQPLVPEVLLLLKSPLQKRVYIVPASLARGT